jgi:hypothetical protein
MKHLEEKAESDGWKDVTLDVSLPSRGFYESLGYELSEGVSVDVGEGQRLDHWKAKKQLV